MPTVETRIIYTAEELEDLFVISKKVIWANMDIPNNARIETCLSIHDGPILESDIKKLLIELTKVHIKQRIMGSVNMTSQQRLLCRYIDDEVKKIRKMLREITRHGLAQAEVRHYEHCRGVVPGKNLSCWPGGYVGPTCYCDEVWRQCERNAYIEYTTDVKMNSVEN